MRRLSLILSVFVAVVVPMSGAMPAWATGSPDAALASHHVNSGTSAKVRRAGASRVVGQSGRNAPACPSVLLLGARGSGEAGPGSVNWQNGSSKDNYGYGPDIWNTFQRIKSDIGTQRTFQETSVIYAADSVNILKQNPFTYPAKYFRDLA